jgi:hypothetical protein
LFPKQIYPAHLVGMSQVYSSAGQPGLDLQPEAGGYWTGVICPTAGEFDGRTAAAPFNIWLAKWRWWLRLLA